MKETLSEINKQIFWHRLGLLWHSAKYICYWISVIFWLHSPFLLAFYLVKSIFPILALLCVPMFLFNGRLLREAFFTDTDEKLTLKKNEIRSVIYEKACLKKLLKKGETKKLDFFECNELYNILVDAGVDKEEAKELVNKYKRKE